MLHMRQQHNLQFAFELGTHTHDDDDDDDADDGDLCQQEYVALQPPVQKPFPP